MPKREIVAAYATTDPETGDVTHFRTWSDGSIQRLSATGGWIVVADATDAESEYRSSFIPDSWYCAQCHALVSGKVCPRGCRDAGVRLGRALNAAIVPPPPRSDALRNVLDWMLAEQTREKIRDRNGVKPNAIGTLRHEFPTLHAYLSALVREHT